MQAEKLAWALISVLLTNYHVLAQEPPQDDVASALPSLDGDSLNWKKRLWVSAQINSITQNHLTFAPDKAQRETASSNVLTMFAGFRLTRSTEVFLDIESTSGRLLPSSLGVAGFTSSDTNPAGKPYLARYLVRQVIGLGKNKISQPPGPLGLAAELPERRIELRFGKLSTADFLDVNGFASDNHLQFVNWTVDDTGYDYAAEPRGHTYGAAVEYYDRNWIVRFAEGLMPTIANGSALDGPVARLRSENLEIEYYRKLLPFREGNVRVLAYLNHANMGTYRQTIDQYTSGLIDTADVAATRRKGNMRYGFTVNVEQSLTKSLRAYARWRWNEGRHESYAYTEVNQSIAAGLIVSGSRWRRRKDAIGLAMVANGISGDHRRYRHLGDNGFLSGNGGSYRPEQITEAFYRWYVGRGVSIAPDLQRVVNPAYNRNLGAVFIASLRLHVEIGGETFRGLF